MKTPTLTASSHARYNWEINCPAGIFGKRIRHFFVVKAEAEACLRELVSRIRASSAAPITRDEHLLLARWRGRLTLAQMESAFGAAYEHRVRSSLTVKTLADAFLHHQHQKQKAGVISPRHFETLEYIVPIITDSPLAGVDVADLCRDDVQRWLDGMTTVMGRTRVNRRRGLSAILAYGVREGLLEGNACDGTYVSPESRPVSIITPGCLDTLLTTASSRPDKLSHRTVFWWLVFGAFAGLRSSEINRLDWSDIRPVDGELYVRKGKTKNAERWVSFTPPLLTFDWASAPTSGLVLEGVGDRKLSEHKRIVYAEAGESVGVNALRHSFGSHHLVAYKEPHQTAAQLGHASPLQTFAAYRRAVPVSQARAYWNVRLDFAFGLAMPSIAALPVAT
jgi:integrase